MPILKKWRIKMLRKISLGKYKNNFPMDYVLNQEWGVPFLDFRNKKGNFLELFALRKDETSKESTIAFVAMDADSAPEGAIVSWVSYDIRRGKKIENFSIACMSASDSSRTGRHGTQHVWAFHTGEAGSFQVTEGWCKKGVIKNYDLAPPIEGTILGFSFRSREVESVSYSPSEKDGGGGYMAYNSHVSMHIETDAYKDGKIVSWSPLAKVAHKVHLGWPLEPDDVRLIFDSSPEEKPVWRYPPVSKVVVASTTTSIPVVEQRAPLDEHVEPQVVVPVAQGGARASEDALDDLRRRFAK
jgi:hypothetical protein